MKITIFYLNSEEKIYAFSSNKKYIKMFKEQRNMRLFSVKTEKMDKYVAMLFMEKYKNKMLMELPLYDGDEYLTIIGTNEEDNELTESSDQIDSDFAAYRMSLLSYPFNEKSYKVIDDITDITSKKKNEDGTIDITLEVNTFELFYHIFKKTFIEEEN